jgi:hypothetical protein
MDYGAVADAVGGEMTAAPQFPPVVVRDDRGNLRGLLIGQDPDRGQCLVAVNRLTAPAWFQEAHVSNCPHVWVEVGKVVRE